MREILFRGKRVDSDEWVYGCYYESKISGCFILVPKIKVRKKDGVVIGDSFDVFEVIPETIGQFTGLCDKNGKKIFEGDIVKSPNGTQGFIEWQNAECAFLVNIGDDWQTMDDCPYEVVGNIYDNEEEE